MAVKEQGQKIIDKLLGQYEHTDNVYFVGEYLRFFTRIPTLLRCFMNVYLIKVLLRTVLNTDFNIQGDAVETIEVSHKTLFQLILRDPNDGVFVQHLLLTERPMDMDWASFISDNKEELVSAFSDLYNEITGEEEDEEEKQDDDDNEGDQFFAM